MNTLTIQSFWLGVSVVFLGSVATRAQSFAVDHYTFSGGGGVSTNGDYVVAGTIGQPGAAMLTGGDYILQSGFWSLELAVQTPGAPYLSVKRVGANVEISWPAGTIGFSLEATGSLVGTINWSGVGQTPAIVDGQNVVALPVQPGQRFFRLLKP